MRVEKHMRALFMKLRQSDQDLSRPVTEERAFFVQKEERVLAPHIVHERGKRAGIDVFIVKGNFLSIVFETYSVRNTRRGESERLVGGIAVPRRADGSRRYLSMG